MKSIILSIYLVLISFTSYGQTLPMGALPMEYNSSFAGQAGAPRISSNVLYHYWQYSSDQSSINKRQNTGFVMSYDQFIPAIASGLSVTAMNYSRHANWGPNSQSARESSRLEAQMVSVAIAPKISIRGKYTLSPSLDFSYNQVTPRNTNSLYEAYKYPRSYSQSRAALLFNTNRFYVGYSIYLLNQNIGKVREQLYNEREPNFLSFLQMGYTFRRSEESKFSFTPQLALRIGHTSLDQIYAAASTRKNPALVGLNLDFKYNQINWGINNTGFHVGWQNQNLRVMISGFPEVSYSGARGTSMEGFRSNLSVRYIFNNNKSKSLF
jgi:hypothetical protein